MIRNFHHRADSIPSLTHSQSVPIIHPFLAGPSDSIQCLHRANVCPCWSAKNGKTIRWSPYEFVSISRALPNISSITWMIYAMGGKWPFNNCFLLQREKKAKIIRFDRELGICIRVCIYIYIYMGLFVYIHIFLCVFVYTCICACIYIYRYTCVCVYSYTCVCVYVYIYIYIYVYICIHIYVYMCCNQTKGS